MRQSKLLVAASLLLVPVAPSADRKHKQPMTRHEKGKFVAFAYTSSGKTVEGISPVAGKTIAADPSVLPLGTLVQVSGAGPWSGEYRVGDIGGKIKGRKVDIFVNGKNEAINFGRREVDIAVLQVPSRRPSETGSRARRTSSPVYAEKTDVQAHCNRCKSNRGDIMKVDEAWGTNSTSGVETGRTGSYPWQDDSGEDGSTPAFTRLSSFTGTFTD